MSPKKPCTQGRRDDSTSPAAAEEVGGNEDLIIEILLRLPATSLIRFKLVSKQWSSLISDPHFAVNHTIRPNPTSTIPSALFFYNSLTKSQIIQTVSLVPPYSPSRVPPLPFPTAAFDVVKIKILQSCNGLLLIRFSPLTTEDHYNVKIYCVCNPTTKKYKILPQPPETPPEEILDCSLAFDPSQSPHYKVVCVKSLRSLRYSDRDRKIEIYSSELGTWRTSTCPFKAPGNTKFDCGVYWNGKLHWLSEYFVVHFDINDESYREIELPPKQDAFYSQPLRYFGECRGHLHMIYVRSPGANRFRVLERDRDTLKWLVKYRVHLSRLITPFPEIVVKNSQWVRYNGVVEYVFSVLCVYKGQKEEDSELVLTIPGKVISYNFHCKTTKVLRELPGQVGDTRDSRYNYATASYFVETLASL